MILHLKRPLTEEELKSLLPMPVVQFNTQLVPVAVLPAAVKEVPKSVQHVVVAYWVSDSEIQLASKGYLQSKREVVVGNVCIGGSTNSTLLFAGPCSVESEAQIEAAARMCVQHGVKVLRAGAFKPRTSPYSFQGLGMKGLQLLADIRQRYGLMIVTEARDSTHIDAVIEHCDIVQVGAKAMYDQGILRACAKTQKPVLIKRGFGSTVQEWVQAAEFVLCGGNEQVVLCERGIRTFETKTRFTLDLCAVAWVKEYTNLPVILDPSHAMGYAYGVSDLARACVAMGIDGLMVEVHPNPSDAWSDASQQLNFQQFAALRNDLEVIAAAVGRKLV